MHGVLYCTHTFVDQIITQRRLSIRRMFKLFQRVKSFEQQLKTLADCGIFLHANVQPQSLLLSNSREQFERRPYTLLLSAMGQEAENATQAGPSGFPSDSIWVFDSECIEGPGSYVRIANRMAQLAQGELPLTNLADQVDELHSSAGLSFTLDGQRYDWDAKLSEDWADMTILFRLGELLNARKGNHRFTYVNSGGQSSLIGCSTISNKDCLSSVTGLQVQWLTKARASNDR